MRIKHEKVLIVFTTLVIRPYNEQDQRGIISIYKSAFAEPPWNEFKKCSACGINYGREEVARRPDTCKNCQSPFTLGKLVLEEFWTAKEITNDLENALSAECPIVLVAESEGLLVGFTWGYLLPFDKFPFLNGLTNKRSNYMDEIAVRGDTRIRGIGTALGKEYLRQVQEQGMIDAVLRTDCRNTASVTLFEKIGYSRMRVGCGLLGSEHGTSRVLSDPEYPYRIYFKRRM